jgi:hypothetical protein
MLRIDTASFAGMDVRCVRVDAQFLFLSPYHVEDLPFRAIISTRAQPVPPLLVRVLKVQTTNYVRQRQRRKQKRKNEETDQ